PGPMDCFMVLRGIKTLHLRMREHSKNGAKVAEFLSKHEKVDQVYYPGLPNHKNHEAAKKQMRSFGGMVAFSLKNDTLKAALEVINKVDVFALAESLGGVESLIGHPASMTHASIPKDVREKTGVKESLLRLSVGIEDIEDIITDLEQALA
ncbi:MAG: PLP-dependent transferase, partial [Flavobacteriales bacterium]